MCTILSRRAMAIVALAAVASNSIGYSSAPSAAAQASPTVETEYNPAIDPADFVAAIDNPYFPLKPGTTFVYEGESGGEAQRDEVTVTGETKVILGVTCVVVRDRVSVEGEVVEDTLDWFAQDKDGNVWYFGEASADYEDGKVVSTEGSWEAGVDGAKPGIIMPVEPRVGDVFRQEYYAGEAEDMAEVIEVGGLITVPYGSFDEILVTKEWSPLEPDVVERKTYAPGVGLVAEVSVQGEEEHLELIDIQVADGVAPSATPSA